MKVEIESKDVSLMLWNHEEKRPARFTGPAFAFQWRGRELGAIHMKLAASSCVCIVLVKPGVGLMDPVFDADVLSVIFNFLAMGSDQHDKIESWIKRCETENFATLKVHDVNRQATDRVAANQRN